MRHWSSLSLVLGGLLVGACSPRASTPAPVTATADAGATAPSRVPPAARRQAPPPGIESLALAVGASVPRVTLPASTGGSWSLSEALRRGPVVLVFYRGDW